MRHELGLHQAAQQGDAAADGSHAAGIAAEALDAGEAIPDLGEISERAFDFDVHALYFVAQSYQNVKSGWKLCAPPLREQESYAVAGCDELASDQPSGKTSPGIGPSGGHTSCSKASKISLLIGTLR